MTKAFHVSESTADGGSAHHVGVGDLKVMIIHDEADGVWYAQGLEIDYLAQGSNLQAVKSAFEVGLKKTIQAHLKAYGDIVKLLKPAASDVWTDFLKHASCGSYAFNTASYHKFETPAADRIFTAEMAEASGVSTPVFTDAADGAQELPFSGIAYYQEAACA